MTAINDQSNFNAAATVAALGCTGASLKGKTMTSNTEHPVAKAKQEARDQWEARIFLLAQKDQPAPIINRRVLPCINKVA